MALLAYLSLGGLLSFNLESGSYKRLIGVLYQYWRLWPSEKFNKTASIFFVL